METPDVNLEQEEELEEEEEQQQEGKHPLLYYVSICNQQINIKYYLCLKETPSPTV